MEFELTQNWEHYLQRFKDCEKDIYFQEKYIRLYETERDKAFCFVCLEKDKCMLFPFLRREFNFNGDTYYDFETCYGYGGPIYNTKDSEFIESALCSMSNYCVSHNYVAGFTRFHPLLNNDCLFDKVGSVINDRQTISVNLQDEIDSIWMTEIHTKNRNVIKKCISNNLEFIIDTELHYFDDFARLYTQTMSRLNADQFYYFNEQYYRNILACDNVYLGIVKYDNHVISSAIFMQSSVYSHYHLSGSDREYLSLSPNNFMLWKAVEFFKQKGACHFHLGGGTDSSETNSLLLFKQKFSKSRYDFRIGKQIFNQEIYAAICSDWEQRNPDKADQFARILLKYRY